MTKIDIITNLLNRLINVLIILRIDRLIQKYHHLQNLAISEFLKIKINSKFRVSILSPFRIIGYRYIHANGSFEALSDLRIECLDYYKGRKYFPYLEIGNNVSFGQRNHIACINRIIIGDNVLIGSNILITDHSHGNTKDLSISPSKRQLISKGEVRIGDNVWICDNVCILPNVTIGHNCIIGAAAIVNKNIPDNCLAVGNPVKITPIVN